MSQVQTTNVALSVPEAYKDVRQQLKALSTANDGVVFEYETTKGQKAAKSHIYQFRTLKGTIEKRRKELKQEALDYGRSVDSVAKELTATVEQMISVHEEPIKLIEAKEAKRKQDVQDRIDNISQSTADLNLDPTADEIQGAVDRLSKLIISDELFGDRMDEAEAMRAEKLDLMIRGLATRQRRDAEQAELAKLRQQALERERQDHEARIAKEAAGRAKAEAEAAHAKREADAKAKAEAERAAHAQREQQAAAREAQLKAEAESAERRAVEAEQRAKEQAERQAREAAEAAEAANAKRAADEQHVRSVMIEAMKDIEPILVLHQNTSALNTATAITQAVRDGKIKNITINF